jgi:hypothetical protein
MLECHNLINEPDRSEPFSSSSVVDNVCPHCVNMFDLCQLAVGVYIGVIINTIMGEEG